MEGACGVGGGEGEEGGGRGEEEGRGEGVYEEGGGVARKFGTEIEGKHAKTTRENEGESH